MESQVKNIFIILVGGIPGIGKSFLSNKICEIYKDLCQIKYLNFDKVENINKDNYLQYQQMRDDYLLKIKSILDDIENIVNNNKSLIVILDDNFFLKSMRKKIYNFLMDKIIELNSDNFKFYYLEILLKPLDLNYCLKMNNLREKNSQIPENIIINMNNIFEYNSPHINNSQILILDIKDEETIDSNIIKEIFNNKEKYIINNNKNNLIIKEKIIIEKNDKAKLIDDIEDIIRKEVNLILKSNEENKKKGKEISKYKKEYMKIIYNNIKNLENNEVYNTPLLYALNNCIKGKNFNISQNQQIKELIKEDFKNFLLEKKSSLSSKYN